MFDYLEKFNKLPKEIRDKVSTEAVMANVDQLEKQYSIDLASVIMKVMVKDLSIKELTMHFVSEFNIEKENALQLVEELRKNVFFDVLNYLGEIDTNRSAEPLKPKNQAIKGANFFFSPEDEEEIRELTKKISTYNNSSVSDVDYDEKLEKIISEAQINFGSEQLLNRFKHTLKTSLRGIRDRIETKQALIKPLEEGGLGFDSESADKVLAMVVKFRDIKNHFLQDNFIAPVVPFADKSKKNLNKKNLHNILARDVDYNLASALKDRENKKDIKENIKKLNNDYKSDLPIKQKNKVAISPPPPALRINKENDKPFFKKEKIIVENKPKFKNQPKIDLSQKNNPEINVRKLSDTGSRKIMEDVKYVPNVMSPIDELNYMSLINFRRLADNPVDITEKIKEKIILLEEESYGKKIEGINGWQNSPVNNIYLEIGRQSISENKSIDVIIDERKKANKDYLTKEEFMAVMDLNKELRF